MRVGFIIYPEMTAFDFVAAYDVVTRVKTMGFRHDLEWDVCAFGADTADWRGLQVSPTRVGAGLADYDLVVVGGGLGTRKLMHDHAFLEWLRSAERCPTKASACTGALLLGAAGFLRGKRVTTHLKVMDQLQPFCREVVADRVVEDGDVITARGGTAALDLGFYLCGKIAGAEATRRIQEHLDYYPPADHRPSTAAALGSG